MNFYYDGKLVEINNMMQHISDLYRDISINEQKMLKYYNITK